MSNKKNNKYQNNDSLGIMGGFIVVILIVGIITVFLGAFNYEEPADPPLYDYSKSPDDQPMLEGFLEWQHEQYEKKQLEEEEYLP
jgi:hypothetical protein